MEALKKEGHVGDQKSWKIQKGKGVVSLTEHDEVTSVKVKSKKNMTRPRKPSSR